MMALLELTRFAAWAELSASRYFLIVARLIPNSLARLYAKFKGSNGCHHVGTPPLVAGASEGFSLSAANAVVRELPATL